MKANPAFLWSASEDEIQASIIEGLRIAFPKQIVAAIPNGGYRRASEAARMKRTGTLAGMPDLVVVLPNGRTCWIETKTSKGRTSKAQDAVIAALREDGHDVEVCRDVLEAVRFVRSCLNGATA